MRPGSIWKVDTNPTPSFISQTCTALLLQERAWRKMLKQKISYSTSHKDTREFVCRRKEKHVCSLKSYAIVKKRIRVYKKLRKVKQIFFSNGNLSKTLFLASFEKSASPLKLQKVMLFSFRVSYPDSLNASFIFVSLVVEVVLHR